MIQFHQFRFSYIRDIHLLVMAYTTIESICLIAGLFFLGSCCPEISQIILFDLHDQSGCWKDNFTTIVC